MKQYLFFGTIILALLFIAGCGGGGGKPSGEVTYINLSPSDTQVLSVPNPTFKFERNTNDTSSAFSCSGSTNALHDVQLKVIKIDAQTADATVVIDEMLQVPNECRYEIQFPALVLEENTGYAWRVGEPNTAEDAQTKWNSFLYSTISMGTGESDPHACENNMVRDGSFGLSAPRTPWMTSSITDFSDIRSIYRLQSGDEDNDSASFSTPHHVIFQTLSHPIEQGKYYQLKFSLKHQGKADFQIKALAFNGDLDDLQPDTNTSIMAVTGTMTYTGSWVKVTLNPWKANKNFNHLAIAVFNEDNSTITARIDRVCLTESENTGCAQEVGETLGLPDGFDINNTDPVITEFEYLLGSVQDLYPDYNTSTLEWFDDPNNTSLMCSSIGEEISPALEDELDLEMQDPEIDQLFEDINLSDTETANYIHDNENNTTTFQPISSNGVQDSCAFNPHGNPNKPFYGRDIVYIHGLQLPAILGNLKNPKTFQEKWPQDKALFYSGGDIINRATSYWSDHIARELGSTSDPTNSYLITSWSANQRIDVAIHAILTQIKDGMAGTNPNVVLSRSARNLGQCFGANGIVVVTHSTGGLIASSMFGIAQHSDDTNAEIKNLGRTININSYYGDVRFIADRIHMQIGFNSAYGGSRFATVGLAAVTAISTAAATDPLLRFTINSVLKNKQGGTLQDLYPKIWNSTLVDLMPSVVRSRWLPWESSSTIPTLTTTGSFLGKANISPNIGKKISVGFDDLVLPTASQAGRKKLNYVFAATKKYLKDKGVGKARRRGLLKDGRSGHLRFGPSSDSTRIRNYANTPHIAPTGMLQSQSFKGYVRNIDRVSQAQYIPNHYLVLQNSGTHFSNVDHISKLESNNQDVYLGNNYEWTRGVAIQSITPHVWPPYIPPYVTLNHTDHERNYEETAVVVSPDVFNRGYMSTSYASLNEEWVRKKTWGLHLPRITWILKEFRLLGKTITLHMPRLTWYYKEWIKWKRTYHLLHDYENKKGADYIYEHALRP